MSGDTAQLEQLVLSHLGSKPGGASDKEIRQTLPEDMPAQLRMDVYNSLLGQGRLTVLVRQSDNEILYKLVNDEKAEKIRGLEANEQMVLRIIEKAGNVGIWSKILKNKSGIHLQQLNKICKTLENRKLIKEVKSVAAKRKKIWMAYNLEPSTEITGGPWYSDTQELDLDFIDALHRAIFTYLGTRDFSTIDDVVKFVRESRITRETLRPQDIETILNILTYDNKIEVVIPPGSTERIGVRYYRVNKPDPVRNFLSEIPCTVCPVAKLCTPNGHINPTSCEYLNTWLQF